MMNSNLIQSDLTASGPSTLSIFFQLENNRDERRGGVWWTESSKAVKDLETLLMAIV
jgi:hypothetical protein